MPAGLKWLRVAVVATLAVVTALGELIVALYLQEYPRTILMCALGIGGGVIGLAAWFLPRKDRSPRVVASIYAAVLAIAWGLPASTVLPGGVTYARFGRTVVGAMPVPLLDITIRSNGLLWFRNKTHRVTLEEARPLCANGTEVLVIGCGWDGAVLVDEEVLAGLPARVEVLLTPQAVELYERLRREGVRVALLLHSTC